MSERPAAPLYALGEQVSYRDRHNRRQVGEVLSIEANWMKPGRAPLVIYTLRHPTYAGRRIYATGEVIFGTVPYAGSHAL